MEGGTASFLKMQSFSGGPAKRGLEKGCLPLRRRAPAEPWRQAQPGQPDTLKCPVLVRDEVRGAEAKES